MKRKPTKLSVPKTSPEKRFKTTIEAKIDVGFGNSLFLRGQGAGLTWDQGVPLTCVDGKTWRWSKETGERITFKLLLNDKAWSAGSDIQASIGESVAVIPVFS